MNYLYDGSFEGFLSVVFEAFRSRNEPETIVSLRSETQLPMGESQNVSTCNEHADRVWNGLTSKAGMKCARLFKIAFLGEEPHTTMLLWRCLKKAFVASDGGFHLNMLDDDIFDLVQMARRVKHEVHRFHGFVRFQKTADGVYFAAIDPDHDIARLLINHFKARYASQSWVIYDTKRNYGIYYDTSQVMEVVLNNPGFDKITGKLHKHVRAIDQDHYSSLWKAYYDAVNIIERQNHRQMKRAMPRRYWKYLPEKGRGSEE